MNLNFVRSVATAVLLLSPVSLAGQLPSPDSLRVNAAERNGPVRIDGALTEEAWAAAEPAASFIQRDPTEGAPAREQTEVRVLFDDEAIYIGARMHDSSPSTVARQLVRRDERGQFDFFEASLSPAADDRTGYRFRVSAAGVQADEYLFDDVRDDASWDAVWESAAAVDDGGWTAELRIPLSQLRFSRTGEALHWRANFARRRVASNERSYWALESSTRYGVVSVFGRLEGLRLPEGIRRFELRPYALARGRSAPSDPDDPFFSGREAGLNGGTDLRYGIGTAFTLDATLNPDFGQVEVDPAEVNLSAFESFFPERRPFFVEDARIFDYGLSGRENTLFYSRRIGREPTRRTLRSAAFADAPAQSAILGAAKLTGRTAGGLALGGLAAVTQQEKARAFFLDGDSIATFVAEPATAYGVARARQELGGSTQIGAIVTGLRRALPSSGALDVLPSTAFSGGVDWEHTWYGGDWALTGFLAGSHVRGSPEALIEIQRSANHYFQRPDADYLDVDSAATSMTGAEWRLQLDRRGGGNWTGAVWAAQRTPGFEVNDLGFFRGSERLDAGARIQYQENRVGPVLRSYRLSAFTFHNWRHGVLNDPFSYDAWGHAHKNGAVSASASGTFLNYWSLDLEARYKPEFLDDAGTRGGPLLLDPSSVRLEVRGSTDRRARLSLEPSLGSSHRAQGGRSWNADLEIGLRPSSRVELEVEPGYRWEQDPAQYVATTADLGYEPTFGRRYLFAELKRHTATLDTRLNVTFSPTLTLQFFAQPLLSAGDYVTYKALARASSFDFQELTNGTAVSAAGEVRCSGGTTCIDEEGTRYADFDGDGTTDFSFQEQDFRIRSLRGNAVLRWEYRPGSTMFLVWQQSRHSDDRLAREFGVASDGARLFSAPAENMLILKMNYWLDL
jgi:hypothetical protein